MLITLGIVAGAWIGTRMARERGLNVDLFSDMILWMIIWGLSARGCVRADLVGSVLGHALSAHPVGHHQPARGRHSIHGGLIGGILVLIYYTRRYKLNFYQYADLCVPGVAFGIIGGRIGNIMNGTDTVGRVTDWAVGYRWPDSARAFHDGMCVPNPNPNMDLSQYCQTIGGQLVMTAPVHFTQLYGVFIGIILSIAAYLLAAFAASRAGRSGSSGCGTRFCGRGGKKPSASTPDSQSLPEPGAGQAGHRAVRPKRS